MSLRDRIRDAAYNAATTSDGDPAGARRATQTASVLAQAASQHGHTGTAAAVATLGAAAVAAEGALSNYVYPPGKYATFREDGQQ
ncbi:hypothetical protein AQI95_21260 [Streptomyces yokosukanensis]|uniref:Uncharacterized protein n=1 Tax=Streptomyces yokosukanensis TaxID=67386 RepID=A0A101P2Y3_9ACTN|nr:hypothetical protein [Streptomyces yokosukanensis]KUN03970.1 hypothetical protein AQI95_21260 [Streptomyces yokosukanensis]